MFFLQRLSVKLTRLSAAAMNSATESDFDDSFADPTYESTENKEIHLSDISVEDDSIEEINSVHETSEIDIQQGHQNEELTNQTEISKIGRSRRNWQQMKIFQTFKEAAQFLNDSGFRLHETKKIKAGYRTIFRCSAVKRKTKCRCFAERCIIQNNCDIDFVVSENGLNHSHDQFDAVDLIKRKVSRSMRDVIISCGNGRMPAKFIANHIDEIRISQQLFLDEKTPTIPQIYEIVRGNKTRKSPPMSTLGELVEWCENHSLVPENENEPFVLDFMHSISNATPKFNFVITSRRLLKILSVQKTVCIDGTYKLNYHDYPFEIIGTVDMANKFNPLCFACVSNETCDDYAFIFETVKNRANTIFGIDFSPETIIADGADAIRNGFFRAFPEGKVDIMCFVHVLRNVHRRKFENNANRSLIINDIKEMRKISIAEEFKIVTSLFLQKWSEKESDFCAYFEKEWLGVHSNWHYGVADYVPSHNNGQEGFNGIIKKTKTFRERLPLSQFFTMVKELVEDVSNEFENDKRTIEETPIISVELWREAAIWIKDAKFIMFKETATSYIFYVSSRKTSLSNVQFDSEYTSNIKNKTIVSFDQYFSEKYGQFWTTKISKKTDWKKNSKCDCPIFFKQNKCKHILAMALKVKVCKLPRAALNVPLDKKQKRGRKRKVGTALSKM